MATRRERLHERLDALTEDRLALAETALTALAMPDDESVINSDREALAAAGILQVPVQLPPAAPIQGRAL